MNLGVITLNPIFTFSIILIASLIIPEALKRYRMTPVPFYIIAGLLLGPYGLGIQIDDGLVFLGDIGLLFLVFLAGLEVYEMTDVKKADVYSFTIVSAIICFGAGFSLGFFLHLSILSCLLLGTILVSSSIAEIITMVNDTPTVKHRLGGLIIPSIVILDSVSMILLGIIIKLDMTAYSLLLFFVETVLLIVSTIVILPHILSRYFNRKSRKPREGDLKFIVAVLMAIVAVGYLIGLHGIVTAFLVGLVMGRFMPSDDTYKKIYGMGHGMMIPVFFVVLGMRLDIGVLFESTTTLLLPLMFIITLVLSKITGGVIYSQLRKLPLRDGIILGIVLWPQLSATIAATTIGYETGVFDQRVLVSVVLMAVTSALVTPFVLKAYTGAEAQGVGKSNHTVIVGYGRTTSKITYMLSKMNVPIVVVDTNSAKLRKLSPRGIDTVYGNGADIKVLQQAGARYARVILLAIDNEHDLYVAARQIRKINPHCHIIAKIHTHKIYKKLASEKLVDEYIWPEKHSSREAVDKVFSHIMKMETK